MGLSRKQRGRPLNAILLLDKPLGITSNRALQQVKGIYQARKAGHTGSLDPLATGMLPICFGEATKLSAFLLDADKQYRGRCKLGITTTTADGEGTIVQQRPVEEYSEATLNAVIARFCGKIMQIPPMYSALKKDGVPLYKLAREGKEVVREPRQVTIYHLALQRLSADELEIVVSCSKGTYIRTLVEDIGEALGCGAHLSALQREQVGPFAMSQMVTMAALSSAAEDGFAALDALLLPMQEALQGWPAVTVTTTGLFYLQQGQAVQIPRAPDAGWVRIFTQAGEFMGVGAILEDGRVAPKRLFVQHAASGGLDKTG
ncbi:MAG: tRNA pseudouridine(55) synthase TruB [Gammaproteobacteria bacterium]|nr:tRNA pseudouridine(55) synthase TruB [Gammaproteobacteria bacterium]